MKKLLWIIPLTVVFFACEKDDNDASPGEPVLTNGLYTGTFSRTGMDTVIVSIKVSGENFEGQSERQFYPAICRGSLRGDNGGIYFSDSCVWQANFDWSLILNGRYDYTIEGYDVRLRRNNGATVDEYLLKKASR